MIITVTLNPALDRFYQLSALIPGVINRAPVPTLGAGGKGLNVSRVLHSLGDETLATGYLGGFTGKAIAQMLKKEGIPTSFVSCRKETRQKIAICDADGEVTEINEPGPVISSPEYSSLFDHFTRLIKTNTVQFVTLCGSLSPGIHDAVYSELICIAHKFGTPAALDTSGAALDEGVKAAPMIIKPNLSELKELAGNKDDQTGDIIKEARSLLQSDKQIICVTDGARSAWLITRKSVWRAQPPVVNCRCTLGSGDAFLAGLLHSLLKSKDMPDALKMATALGAANASSVGAGIFDRIAVEDCIQRTGIYPVI